MNRPEQAIHRQIVAGLRDTLPNTWIVAHIPNGGKRTKVEGAIFKALGTLPGMPDIIILGADAHGSATAWFLEVKAGRGKPTDIQAACHQRLRDLGFAVEIVTSWTEAKRWANHWRLPMRFAQ